jgi:hypothetical protein
MRFQQYFAFQSQDATQNASSAPIDISSCVGCAIQVHVVSGTVKGTAQMQVSLDPINSAAPNNWTNVSVGAKLNGSAGTDYDYIQLAANWLRVSWTNGGSSSPSTFDCHVKTIGY